MSTCCKDVVEAPDGRVDLGLYPGLVYDPARLGEGIRFAHNGLHVELAADGPGNIEAAFRAIEAQAEWLEIPFADFLSGCLYLHSLGRI